MLQRIKWIDFGKGITILLVVIGHVSLGLLQSGKFSDNGKMLLTLVQMTYIFHMPVFFALSGFFFKTVNSKRDFIKMFRKKLISLGVPYVAFSLVMMIMKKVGGGSVRNPINITTFIDIYKQPIDHLWFLYVLFGIFIYMGFLSLFIKNDRVLLVISLIGYVFATIFPTHIYIIQRVLVWGPMFILGKMLNGVRLKKYVIYVSGLAYVVYLIGWMIFNFKTRINYFVPSIDGIIFPISILLAFSVYSSLGENSIFFDYFTKYGKISLPIYLIHVPVASIIRIVLLRFGVTQVIIQLVIGIVGAWFISIFVFQIVHRIKFLDFFLYPLRYVNKKVN
ncbi:acyltransferase family protein [Pediococcus pentosaceus]|uniref:acyltransferase family protein n=1 Tax=Pediococcus pentosaceus TaxID=1255 RepID=UPI00223B6375|nr:acyltransferase [Pediococcus pentosaceus]MCS8569824.1 acyltransferase [Pediococcus pentosaceus]